MGTHDFDALRFVLGGDVREVTGMTSAQGFAAPGIEDQVMAILGLDGGALASLHAAYNLGFGSSAFDVHGTEGSLIGRTVLAATGVAELVLRTAAGERTIDLGPPRLAYEGTVEAFNAAVRGQGAPAASGVDGLRSIAIASAVRESAREGKTVPVLSMGDSTPGEER
jgi:1,5-anhydro-D-fructose reductase (1,5-anhydro-D-mannitol-forming)